MRTRGGCLKVTRHVCFKNRKNLRHVDILAGNSANKPSFQNLTKSPFAQCSIDGSLAESQARNVYKRQIFAICFKNGLLKAISSIS